MTLIRAVMLALAVLLPTSWTLAHAGEEGADKSAETKPKKSKKSKKKEGGDSAGGDMKKDEAK